MAPSSLPYAGHVPSKAASRTFSCLPATHLAQCTHPAPLCHPAAIGLLSDPNHQGLDVNVSSHTAIDTTNLQCTMPQFEHTLEGAEGVTGQHKSHPLLLATAEVQAVRQSVLASRSVPASSLEPRQHRPLLPGSTVQPPLQEGHLQPDALPGKQADKHLQISLITSLPGHGTDGEHAPDTDIDSSCSAMLTPNATHGSRAAAAYKTQYDLGMVARCASESMAQTWASLAAFEGQGYGRGMPHLVAAAKDGSQMGQQQQQPGGRLAGGTAQRDVLGAAVGDM